MKRKTELALASAFPKRLATGSDRNIIKDGGGKAAHLISLEDEENGAKSVKAGGKRQPAALPWMRHPVLLDAGTAVPLPHVRGLSEQLRHGLEAEGYSELFAVQAAVWQLTAGGASAAHDLCISAPTGSGKTLAYALPILAALQRMRTPALRALVVLPTRDLASQVYRVFARMCPGAGLTVGLMAGKADESTEAAAIVAQPGSSGADIVVATPGRLTAHLRGTPGFNLAALRFLVVDETDRLLRQAYQDWLPAVAAAIAAGGSASDGPATSGRRVVKFVVSATLTRDPSKIERLSLHCPRYVAMSAGDHRYQLPKELSEFKVLCPAARKPALLAALLTELAPQGPTIVFTASVDMAHRLHEFVDAVEGMQLRAVEYSSLVPPAKRAANLAAFRSGRAQVLVASDAMTRGMDVEGVAQVLNYDAPVYAKTYVHRCGRTARAGHAGRAFTLLRKQDMRHFKAMLRKLDNSFVKDYRPAAEVVASLEPGVAAALAGLRGGHQDLDADLHS